MVRYATGWEPWEARRAAAAPWPAWEVRDRRQDARLLLRVVRARLGEGAVPVEHAAALAGVAEDGRVPLRRRRVAASLLGEIRLRALAGVLRPGSPPSARSEERRRRGRS